MARLSGAPWRDGGVGWATGSAALWIPETHVLRQELNASLGARDLGRNQGQEPIGVLHDRERAW
jgi:hypothetical protein